MRKIFLLLVVAIILSGCSVSKQPTQIYEGKALKIGVIGETPKEEFKHVTFYAATPDDLKQQQNKYDAFFITKAYFEELATDSWVAVFEEITTPTFFIGSDYQAFIFRMQGMDYVNNSPEATEHVQGFVNNTVDASAFIKKWGYGEPRKTKHSAETPKWIFYEVFRDIENYAINNNR